MINQVTVGHCLEVLKRIPDKSVHCCVTSPPYFALRDYGLVPALWPEVSFSPMPGLPPLHVPEQESCLGLEKDIWAYVGHMVAVFREVWRVMRDDGVLWLNLGDSYQSSNSQQVTQTKDIGTSRVAVDKRPPTQQSLKPKDLMGIPWRVAYALQADGWYLRSDVIWHKCLSGGTVIYAQTQKGEMPMTIKDVVRLDPSTVKLWDGEKWNQVKEWIEVNPSEDRKNKSLKRRIAKYRNNEILPVLGDVEIELRNGERIGCTQEHRWPTYRGLIQAKDLIIGDVIKSVSLPESSTIRMPRALDDNYIGWFIGLYIAEGSMSQGSIHIASHIREEERYQELCKISEMYDGYCFKCQTSENGMTIVLNSPVLRGIIEAYISGTNAYTKHLNTRCWKRSNRFLDSILTGYLDGDGHKMNNGKYKLGFTNNDALAQDLRTLCARLGYSLRLKRVKHTMNGQKFPGWRGTICFDPTRRRLPDSQIVAIRQSRARKFYDIVLKDEPHTFALASGLLTHNSNPMPESVTDRPTKAHEYVFLMSKSEKYFYDGEAIREENSPTSGKWGAANKNGKSEAVKAKEIKGEHGKTSALIRPMSQEEAYKYCTNGRNRRTVWTVNEKPPYETFQDWAMNRLSEDTEAYKALIDEYEREQSSKDDVWQIATQSYEGAHFATFPTKLIEPMILASTSEEGICGECGAQWVRVVEKIKGDNASYNGSSFHKGKTKEARKHLAAVSEQERTAATVTTGWRPSCSCNAPIAPAIVLDPFGGSGTTGKVALANRRNFILIDANPVYAEELATERLNGTQIKLV